MATITVVGPLTTEAEARSTAEVLGLENHSVYSRYLNDSDGYVSEQQEWYVERDDAIPGKIFGYEWREIQAKQARISA
ncbi:MAG: hypothetical protein PHV02_07155 [Rhodocyclaceae bacterium]|nr:hypothetical protein [Rhodocyclaceae bacterium]